MPELSIHIHRGRTTDPDATYMSHLNKILDFVHSHELLTVAPDARYVVDYSSYPQAGHPFLTMPMLVCEAMGGDAEKAIPIAAGWVLTNLATEVFDDIQDRDPRYPWSQDWPLSRSLNAGQELIHLGYSCFARSHLDADAKREIQEAFSEALVTCALGQSTNADRILNKREYWEQAAAKSGANIAAAAFGGARITTAEPSILTRASRFGMAVGTLTQVVDDIGDMLGTMEEPHPTEFLYSLPVILAYEQKSHPHWSALNRLISEQSSEATAVRAKDMLELVVEMNGIRYAFSLAKAMAADALGLLGDIASQPADELTGYINNMVQLDLNLGVKDEQA